MDNKSWLEDKLKTVGKGTFKGCYDVYAKNYMKYDKSDIDEAIEKYGKSTGYTYTRNSVNAKRNAGCAIFRAGLQNEALKLCK